MHRCINQTWADEVDPDPLRRQFCGRAGCQPELSVLRGDVGSAACYAEKRVHCPDVDNGSATSASKNRWGLILQAEKVAFEVRIEDAIPILLGEIRDSSKSSLDSGIVHCIVEP